ncbi:DUF4276 family protein [Actinokineospora enzanensis]|uniref:DUF4276 family protein n=1 Tax=Actinokineospora enzanensis TaxID=155975 RepID=UPI00039C0964|nr:DUF4276 family protein [Actinokineospora enzanensis]
MPEYRRLHLLVEGQTEETVVRDLLEPHLRQAGWVTTWSIVITKRPAGGPAYRGGVAGWRKVEGDIRRLLGDSSLTVLTTVIDYYGLPAAWPGMDSRPNGSAHDRVDHVEAAMAAVIDDRRFLPNLVLHEFEAWVFAAARQLGELREDPALAERLCQDSVAAGGPELVNERPETAPSKRLLRYCPDYAKTLDGPLVVSELGLVELRESCPHVHRWLTRLDA